MPTESLRTLMLASLAALVAALAMSSCADICTRHSDCSPGLECGSAGVCIVHVPEAPSDGGDAAAPDAAAPDAAASDAAPVSPDDGEVSPLPLPLHPRDHRRAR